MIKPRTYKWLNAALFQVGWFSCILGSTTTAILATVVLLGIHLAVVTEPKKEALFICKVAFWGFSMDYALSALGYIRFLTDGDFPWFILCLWVLFATTLNWSYNYLVSKVPIAIIAGLLAPLSYFAAQKIGKVEYLTSGVESFIVHALLWISFMILIHFIEFRKEPLNYAR